MPTCASARIIRARIWSRTPSALRTCWKPCAQTAPGGSRSLPRVRSTASPMFPTPEDAPFPVQTSLYGASKLAGEGLIEAYAAGYGFTGLICRFVSILGERYTHGHVFDFFCALKRDPGHLRVLGDGRQEKSYLYVGDCLEEILMTTERHRDDPGAYVYNLGTQETVVVDQSVGFITNHLG